LDQDDAIAVFKITVPFHPDMIEDFLRAILGMPPGISRINKDLAVMRQLTRPLADQIIPWENEHELELMALKMDLKAQKRGMDKILIGTIQSIYFEPMVTFAYRDYVKGVREALLYCRTRNIEFVYRIKRNGIDVFMNGNQVAVIDDHGIMYGLKSRSALGSIRPYSTDLLSIVVLDREAGHLFNPLRPHSDIQRAFFLMTGLKDDEERIFLSLGLYELIIRMITNKRKK
jgi:hypothetical protein